MKKKEKKLTALLLCCTMLVLSFAGCSKKVITEDKTDATATPTATASENKETENTEPMEILWYNINPPYEDDSWGEKTFEELFSVDVKIVRAESDDELSTLLAGGTIPDVMFFNKVEDLGTYQNLGILASLTEDEIKENMPYYYEMCKNADENFFSYAMINGKNYGVTSYKATGGIAQAAVIRADWLKACGFDKVPSTLEELEEVFTAFVNNDPDGNGIKDTYALTSGSDKENGKRFFSSIFGAYGINPFCWTTQDDKVAFGFTTDECKEALKLLHKWYENGLIDPEFVTDECRTSGIDTAYKFANGITGFLDGFPYDDYEWDNDAHVNAKWVAANKSWQDFFEQNKGNEDVLYSKLNVNDFSDDMAEPYYILLDHITGPAGDKSGYYAGSNINGFICFGVQLEEDREKMYRIMDILDQEVKDPEIIINHYGPEGYMWEWNADKTERVWIDNYSSKENYNPQGQIMGNGVCLWPMYSANTDNLSIIGGKRIDQRYKEEVPRFRELPTVTDTVKVSLKTAAENPDLTYAYPLEYIVKAIRGDVDIDSTWDSTIETWNKMGGTQLTEEANNWYNGIK